MVRKTRRRVPTWLKRVGIFLVLLGCLRAFLGMGGLLLLLGLIGLWTISRPRRTRSPRYGVLKPRGG